MGEGDGKDGAREGEVFARVFGERGAVCFGVEEEGGAAENFVVFCRFCCGTFAGQKCTGVSEPIMDM